VNTEPLVSVVMSVYNSDQYLNEAIESILNQTYKNFEFIIIDDGSTDESLEVIKKYKAEDDRIVLISRENKGLPYSLNEGISMAKGEYIARMDADDISLPDRLMEQVHYMVSNPGIGICGTWAEVFGDGISFSILKHPEKHCELFPKLLFSVCFVHPSVMFRTSIIMGQSDRYNEEYVCAQDYELWLKLIKKTEFGNIPKVLLKYRQTSNSITSTMNSSKSNLRYHLLNKVFSVLLCELNIYNNERRSKLHYVVASNERLRLNTVDICELNSYFKEIINANLKIDLFTHKELMLILSKKFFVAVYFEAKRNYKVLLKVIRYKLFYLGLLNYLRSYFTL